MIDRRRLLLSAAALTAGGVSARAQIAGAPVRIVFPFTAGGAGDALCRLIGDKLAATLNRPVIVENKTGADGRIGIQSVKAAAADGDTLLVTTGPTMWLYPMVHTAPGYDPHADFAAISLLGRFEFCVSVALNTGIKSMAELAAWVKANPDKAAYGVPGAGTIPHFTGVALAKLFGTELRRVPYRGSVPAINDLVAGQIPIVITTLADTIQQHRGGTVRILAVSSKSRSSLLADVPTLTESGYALTGDAWYGLWAPARTPGDKIEALNRAVRSALADPVVKAKLEGFAILAEPSSPDGLSALMRADAANWAEIVKASGFRMEQ
jgi:tripartite-type tricarboxylate transporter receptor subunit TctC